MRTVQFHITKSLLYVRHMKTMTHKHYMIRKYKKINLSFYSHILTVHIHKQAKIYKRNSTLNLEGF